MSPLATSFVVLGCVSAGAGFGMTIGQSLARQHLIPDSKEVLKLGMGLIATLAALVLGLLVAATKGTYDTQSGAVRKLASDVLLLDRLMAVYGPESKEARATLHKAGASLLAQLDTAADQPGGPTGGSRVDIEEFYTLVANLPTHDDSQRSVKDRALGTVAELGQTRLRMITQGDHSIPAPFLSILVFWLVILFIGYGLMAPRNWTIAIALAVCALSVSGALFLILELDRPLSGVMRVSTSPLRNAVSLLGG